MPDAATMTATRPAGASQPPAAHASTRQVVAGAIGNVLEWYDFAAYGYFASIFAKNFFPSSNGIVSLASAFGVFAAAFLMRPIGGALFGHVGDRFGRKQALVTSAGLMTVSTMAIGLLPTYETAGALAPLLLILLRLLQGLSVGGEFSASIIFLVERAEPRRRGLLGSFASVGATCGILIGSGVGAVASWLMTPAELQAWGWRIPFLLGIVLGGVAFVLRAVMHEDGARAGLPSGRLPLIEALEVDWREILRGMLACSAFAATFYLVFIYLVTMMHQVDGIPLERALQVNTACMVLLVALTPLAGWVSDRIGRKPLMLVSTIGTIVLAVPLFWLLTHPEPLVVAAGQALFAVLIAAWAGPMEAMLVELYRGRTRCTALSISYNTAFALLGGTSPMIAVYLVSEAKLTYGPAYYLMALGLLSLAAALTIPDRSGQPLR
ncbi:MAG: MFS transporter [Rhodospirillales bacterium]|nr:MFS transporter [Rhodospirillales bacterium]